MFTIKLYDMAPGSIGSPRGYRQVIKEAESFTILRGDDGTAEITLHQKNPELDSRIDINGEPASEGFPRRYESAIIENASGRTTEMINLRPRT